MADQPAHGAARTTPWDPMAQGNLAPAAVPYDAGPYDAGSNDRGSNDPGSNEAVAFHTPPLDLAEKSPLGQQATWAAPAWQERQRWIPWLRLWALVKMASLTYTTWWAVGYLHERVGTQICAYGAMCLYAAVRSRWSGRRFRLFGPGMSIEPEFYEELGRWFYRAGVVLVLCGGVIFVAQGTLGTSATGRHLHHHNRPAPAAPATGTNG